MARTIEVKRVGMKKYDNSLHVRYHSEIYGIVKQYDLTKIGLTTALMDEWNGDINLEGDINKEAGMNVNTERMLKKDEERGKLITFIFNAIRNARQSPDDNESDAAMTLYTVIRSYDGLQQEAHERKSADIFGLVTDLRKTENAPFVTALHLTNAVNKLETVNKAYDEFVAKRAKDRTAAAELPPARVVRPKTDEVFDHIVFAIQSAYIFGTAPVEKELITKMVAEMNQRTREIEEAYHRSLAEKKANRKKDPNQPKDPKPKKPKKKDNDPDIHLPEKEEPKKPEDGKDKKPEGGGGSAGGGTEGGGGGGPEIHLPKE